MVMRNPTLDREHYAGFRSGTYIPSELFSPKSRLTMSAKQINLRAGSQSRLKSRRGCARRHGETRVRTPFNGFKAPNQALMSLIAERVRASQEPNAWTQ